MNVNIMELKKYYKDKLVLDIEKLNIKNGRITGIIGPNGSGKTTLLNIIAGLDEDFYGEINFDGRLLDNEIGKKMTLVFQKPYLFKRTVYDNIAYPLKIRKLDKVTVNQKVNTMMNKLDIGTLKNQKAHTLSGGESQKVSLARALVFEPDLLLLDEPTSNIDADSVKVMERELIKYNEEKNATIIIVTHNMEQAKRLCTDYVHLDKGRVMI